MIRWFKKHFIPHQGNNHQPHFLRGKNTRLLILAIFMLELGVLVLPFIPAFNLGNNSFLAAILPAVLDDLTNQNRQSQHLAVLTVNPLLNKAAELKAQDMADKGYFAHVSPEGKAPWYWFKQVGYKYEYAGENLAIDFTDSQDVTLAWMNSPTHRANIVKNAYTEMGTGIATGTFEGNATIFVAQVYGKPASAVTSVVTTNEPEKVIAVTVPIAKITPPAKVMGASVEVAENTEMAPIVDTAPEQTYSKTTFFEKYLTSPRHIANIILGILAVLVALALIFKLFIRMDKKHPRLITNGCIVLVIIFGVYVANNYMAQNKLATKTSFVGFQGDQVIQNK
ncbi:MAG: CAP domain-containing protein [Candidatus Taylorbacteria bacterium]|nr:CAP domain-containing protein [Candidatus Taylorbacteria bacterium]